MGGSSLFHFALLFPSLVPCPRFLVPSSLKLACYHEAVNDLYDRVDRALDEIRPYIHSHAGDVNIVDVSDAGVVKLQMVGTCHGCPMSMLTLRLGIERILMEKVNGVTGVQSIRPDELDFGDIEAEDDPIF
jgi:Fe-S cluster biogenesis protein NfuA